MIKLLKKYTILVVTSIILVRLIGATLIIFWPDLLTTKISATETHKFVPGFIETGIGYLINIIFIFLLHKEMKNQNFRSIPVLILTFFSNLLGVIFFFLIIAYNMLITKQIDYYD